MKEKSENCCGCSKYRSREDSILTDYYNFFVPTGWSLSYTTLEEPEPERILYLLGKCSQCGGLMRCETPIAGHLTREALMSDICRAMSQYRPYDRKDRSGLYHGFCAQRSEWYWRQDRLTRTERMEQFTAVFLEKDQQAARRWAEAHMPAAVRRETPAEFFQAVMTLVRVNGYWPEQNDFIICEPACPPWPPDAVLSRLDFDFCPVLGFGPGGELQIDCCLDGIFDGSGRRRLRLGTIKTVCTGHDTCLMMGLLTSALLYYGEIHRANLAQTAPGKDQRGPRVVRKERKENENGVFILRMQPAHGRKP